MIPRFLAACDAASTAIDDVLARLDAFIADGPFFFHSHVFDALRASDDLKQCVEDIEAFGACLERSARCVMGALAIVLPILRKEYCAELASFARKDYKSTAVQLCLDAADKHRDSGTAADEAVTRLRECLSCGLYALEIISDVVVPRVWMASTHAWQRREHGEPSADDGAYKSPTSPCKSVSV